MAISLGSVQFRIMRVLRDRTFIFRPLVAESEVTRTAAQDLLSRVFQGSISGLMAHLLDNEEVTPDEMKRLRALVDAKSKEIRS
jgi:BlaI family penicillinase repressor